MLPGAEEFDSQAIAGRGERLAEPGAVSGQADGGHRAGRRAREAVCGVAKGIRPRRAGFRARRWTVWAAPICPRAGRQAVDPGDQVGAVLQRPGVEPGAGGQGRATPEETVGVGVSGPTRSRARRRRGRGRRTGRRRRARVPRGRPTTPPGRRSAPRIRTFTRGEIRGRERSGQDAWETRLRAGRWQGARRAQIRSVPAAVPRRRCHSAFSIFVTVMTFLPSFSLTSPVTFTLIGASFVAWQMPNDPWAFLLSAPTR